MKAGLRTQRIVSGILGVAGMAGSSLFGFPAAQAAPVSPGEVREVLKSAAPGAEIVVQDGQYRDLALEWEGTGEKERPITIRAENPGGVVFSGRSGIELKGRHLVLDGFLFTDGESPEKYVIDVSGSDCRLTNTVIDGYNPADPEGREDKWVSLRGQRHRVDHCTFHNKRSKSVTLTVWREPGREDRHVIERNHFHTRARGAEGNGYETIRIGTSEESESDSFTQVRENLFERCDGEMEAVSVKAGRCELIGNTFLETAGTLTLRHGQGSLVSGNHFIGKRKEATGGVRIYGRSHAVSGNVFIGLTGRGGAALSLMAGEPKPKLNGYQAVEQALVEKNLFAANVGPAIRMDEQFDADDRPVLAKEVILRGNVLSGSDLDGLVAGGDRPGLGVTWAPDNRVYAANQIPQAVTGDLPPPLTRADVGAAWFRGKLP